MREPEVRLQARLRRCIGVALGLMSTVAAAQDSPQESEASRAAVGTLDEVIVTGTKRAEESQDVPISISAISSDTLERASQNDVRALGTLAPGLVLSNPAGFNATGGGMRGTGTNIILVTQDAPVSFLMDEFALSHVTSQFLTLFDVEQIEVYRGPQGTLFGKNTTGGVISVTSKRPQIGKYEGTTELSYGQYDNGASVSDVNLAVNLPLSDTLALRIAGIYDRDDGFYTDDKRTSTFPQSVPLWGLFGVPEGTLPPEEVDTTVFGAGGRLGGKSVLAAKAKLLWQPTESYEAYFILEYVEDRSDSPPGVNESIESDLLTLLGFPGNQLVGQDDVFSTLISHNANIEMDEGHRVDTQGVYLTQTLDALGGEFTSVTGYREQVQRLPSTYTGEAFLTLFDSTRNTERYTFQQELRYASNFDGPFNFVGGANYFHDNFNFRAHFSVGLTSLVPFIDPDTGTAVRPDGRVSLDTRALFDYQFQGTEQSRDEYAVFWDGTFEFNEKFSVTGGVRYSADEKEFLRFVDGGGPCTDLTEAQDIRIVDGECRDARSHYTSRAGITPREFDGRNIPLPLSAFGTIVDTSDEWSETTWRVVFDYKPNDTQLVYLSYATGFLSGGFSETCATPERCAYDPETNNSLELGWKADLLDSKLRLNAAVYFTEYDQLQRAVVAAYTAADGTSQQETVTVNTGSSEALGVDVEATWVPQQNLRLTAALNWLDHDYTSGVLPDLRGTNNPIPLEPFEVPYSPEIKASLGVEYDWQLANQSHVLWGLSINHQDEAETDVFNGVNTQMQERTLIDVSATLYDSQDRWSIMAYVSNVTDEEYRIAALPVAGLWNFTNYGAPRLYGLTLNVNFGE